MTTRGKIILTLVILAVVGVGGWKWWGKLSGQKPLVTHSSSTAPAGAHDSGATPTAPPSAGAAPAAAKVALAESLTEVTKLAPPGVYQPKDNIVEIELSEYAGYAGLIVANGGLAPRDRKSVV